MAKTLPARGSSVFGSMPVVPMIQEVVVYCDTNADTSIDSDDVACTTMSIGTSTRQYQLFDIPAGTYIEDILLVVDCAFHADTKLAVTIGDNASADTYWLDTDMDVTTADSNVRSLHVNDTMAGFGKGGKWYTTSDQITITFTCGTTDATLDQGLMRVWVKYWRLTGAAC